MGCRKKDRYPLTENEKPGGKPERASRKSNSID